MFNGEWVGFLLLVYSQVYRSACVLLPLWLFFSTTIPALTLHHIRVIWFTSTPERYDKKALRPPKAVQIELNPNGGDCSYTIGERSASGGPFWSWVCILPFVHGAEMPGCVGGTCSPLLFLNGPMGKDFPAFVRVLP
jgi:hypothetical protein